jgi:predicted ester cyclase
MTSFFNLIFSFIKRLFVSNISNEEKLKSILFDIGIGDNKLNFSFKYFEKLFSEKISIVKIVVDKRIPKM